MDRRFRLQPVLNYRQSLEDALQLELARLQIEEQAARAQLEILRTESSHSMEEIRSLQLLPRPDIGAIQQGFVYLGALGAAIEHQVVLVLAATERLEAKRRAVIAAMQDRKVLEKLKQRHDRAYAEWATQVEARELDDMVTVRYRRSEAEVGQ